MAEPISNHATVTKVSFFPFFAVFSTICAGPEWPADVCPGSWRSRLPRPFRDLEVREGTCSFTMPGRTGSTASNGATSPGGSDHLSYKKGEMAQRERLLRRLTLLARPDQTTNNYYRNFKWQRGKSVTPTLRLGGASVWFIHNPNAMSISVTPSTSTSSSWFFTGRPGCRF